MHNNSLFFFKSDCPTHNCLKVFNNNGDELSLSGDDSCGAFLHLSRTSLCIFPEGTKNTMSGPEQMYVTPDEFLKTLAHHLGYMLVKI